MCKFYICFAGIYIQNALPKNHVNMINSNAIIHLISMWGVEYSVLWRNTCSVHTLKWIVICPMWEKSYPRALRNQAHPHTLYTLSIYIHQFGLLHTRCPIRISSTGPSSYTVVARKALLFQRYTYYKLYICKYKYIIEFERHCRIWIIWRESPLTLFYDHHSTLHYENVIPPAGAAHRFPYSAKDHNAELNFHFLVLLACSHVFLGVKCLT